jgi:putative membrane protein
MVTSNEQLLRQPPKPTLAKKLNIGAWIVTVIVLLLVGLMRRVSIDLPEGWDTHFLVPFHATLNALTAVVLIVGLVFIKQRKFVAHQKTMTLAIVLSALFLLSYVGYHFTNDPTVYGDLDGNGLLEEGEKVAAGSWRTIYLVILLTHIVLAAVIFPFILFTYIRASTNQFAKHKRMARWVYPLWLYVAVTGPVLYWMLKPYYQF